MPDIKIDITQIVQKYLIPIVISFTIGLGLYLAIFNREWEWPTFIGCVVFLVIEAGVWIKERSDYNYAIERKNNRVRQSNQEKAQALDKEIKKAAVLFLHNCKDDAVALYNHPRHPGEAETERYVSFEEMPGFHVATNLGKYEFDPQNEKYRFLFCDNEMACSNGGERHIVFHPLFYQLVGKYIKTGIISF